MGRPVNVSGTGRVFRRVSCTAAKEPAIGANAMESLSVSPQLLKFMEKLMGEVHEIRDDARGIVMWFESLHAANLRQHQWEVVEVVQAAPGHWLGNPSGGLSGTRKHIAPPEMLVRIVSFQDPPPPAPNANRSSHTARSSGVEISKTPGLSTSVTRLGSSQCSQWQRLVAADVCFGLSWCSDLVLLKTDYALFTDDLTIFDLWLGVISPMLTILRYSDVFAVFFVSGAIQN